jgi:hypothetical protein
MRAGALVPSTSSTAVQPDALLPELLLLSWLCERLGWPGTLLGRTGRSPAQARAMTES